VEGVVVVVVFGVLREQGLEGGGSSRGGRGVPTGGQGGAHDGGRERLASHVFSYLAD